MMALLPGLTVALAAAATAGLPLRRIDSQLPAGGATAILGADVAVSVGFQHQQCSASCRTTCSAAGAPGADSHMGRRVIRAPLSISSMAKC
jgi:hypothetical protein